MSTFDKFEVEVDDNEKGLHKLNLEYKEVPQKKKLKDHWEKYGYKIILAIGIILIAGIAFQAGFLKGQKNQKDPVVINQPDCPPSLGEAGAPCPKGEGNSASASNRDKPGTQQPNTENQKCAYVASKNSDKYHLPTCQFAQKIKPENKVCFSSKEEAESRGYQPAKCCIK